MTLDIYHPLRPVRNKDADGLFGLIERCFAEYDGVFVERDGLDADLKMYATFLENIAGEGYVIDDKDQIVALVSCAPLDERRYQLKRLYLDRSLRGKGLSQKMLALVEARAVAAGAASLELWSDTRFKRAHRFYEREGFVRQQQTRDLNDISNTTEYQFIKPLPFG